MRSCAALQTLAKTEAGRSRQSFIYRLWGARGGLADISGRPLVQGGSQFAVVFAFEASPDTAEEAQRALSEVEGLDFHAIALVGPTNDSDEVELFLTPEARATRYTQNEANSVPSLFRRPVCPANCLTCGTLTQSFFG